METPFYITYVEYYKLHSVHCQPSCKLVKITVYNTISIDFPRRQCTINYRKFREVKQNNYRYQVANPTLLL